MKRYQSLGLVVVIVIFAAITFPTLLNRIQDGEIRDNNRTSEAEPLSYICLLYTSPSPRDS